MQWLMVVQPTRPDMLETGPTEKEADAVERHFGYWSQLTEDGVALLVGRTQTAGPDTMGLAIFAAETEEIAWQIVREDAAVNEGVFSAKLFPYYVALLGNAEAFMPAI